VDTRAWSRRAQCFSSPWARPVLISTASLNNHYRIMAENSMKHVLPGGFFGIQILQNSVSSGATSRIPLGELTTLPRPPSRLPIPNPVDAFGTESAHTSFCRNGTLELSLGHTGSAPQRNARQRRMSTRAGDVWRRRNQTR